MCTTRTGTTGSSGAVIESESGLIPRLDMADDATQHPFQIVLRVRHDVLEIILEVNIHGVGLRGRSGNLNFIFLFKKKQINGTTDEVKVEVKI